MEKNNNNNSIGNERKERIAFFEQQISKLLPLDGGDDIFSISCLERISDLYSTSKEAKRIIEGNNRIEKKKLSQNFINTNQRYKDFVSSTANALKFSYTVVPIQKKGISLPLTSSLKEKYFDVLRFMQRTDLPNLGNKILYNAIKDGAYYGLIQTSNKKFFSIIDLPFDFCRTRYKDSNNLPIVEFNVNYFNIIKDLEDREEILNSYPDFISEAYRNKNRVKKWIDIPTNIGICIYGNDFTPLFLPIIPSLIEYEEAKEMEKKKFLKGLKTILSLEFDHTSDGKFIVEPEELVATHNGLVKLLKNGNNENTTAITSYGSLKNIDVTPANEETEDFVPNARQEIYSNAGMSAELFSPESSSSLEMSTTVDLGRIMTYVKKISRYLTSYINNTMGSTELIFKVKILPITRQNEQKWIDNSFKMASSGYSLLLPAITLGFEPLEFLNLKEVENSYFNIVDKLIPPQTSYTNSQDSEDTETTNGRPALDDLDRTDKTNQNIESKQKTGGK